MSRGISGLEKIIGNLARSALVVVLLTGLTLPSTGRAATPSGPPPGAPTDRDPTAYQGMNADQIARVKRGEIVILEKPETVQGRQMITAAIMFNQDINTVWTLMTSGWRQEEYLPHLERSPLIKKWDGGDLIEFHVSIFGVSIDYRILGNRDKSHYHASWKLDPSYDNDMREVSGFWQFYWIDQKHTLGRYGTWVQVTSVIPAAVQEYLTKRDLPDALTAVKRWVDSNGTWRKPGYKPPAN